MTRWFHILLALAAGVVAREAAADRPVADYRYFRALSIDLQGRPPTRDEIAQLERPEFRFDAWIDAHLNGPSYAERLRRVYMDLLRLESSPTTAYARPSVLLRRAPIEGPHGPIDVYYRAGQRRVDPTIDGTFCFSQTETGLVVRPEGAPQGQAHAISQRLLDARTVEIKPWWLYADYRLPQPRDRASPDWEKRFPGYDLYLPLFVEEDKTPTTAIRVCREEAQTADTGRVFTSGRVVGRGGAALLPGRWNVAPLDSTYAREHTGQRISCESGTGFESSVECGCGVGLERCFPGNPPAFNLTVHAPLGIEQPFLSIPRSYTSWLVEWWGEEAKHFIDDVFLEDRDMRDLLTSPRTVINGPLAQFYRSLAQGSCCGVAAELGYGEPEPLFEPARVPTDLVPQETSRWITVADRGPHAAGLLTMPVFLVKYGPRRSRAHILYNAFLCKDFVAESAQLPPSTNPDLTKRPGCATCHTTLEPMAAYFSRIVENDWTYLPKDKFPISAPRCAGTHPNKPTGCNPYYDPAFATETSSTLRGAYADPAHADEGPIGLAREITSSPEFASCVVKNVTQSLLGRQLTVDDDAWQQQLTEHFVAGSYRMRSLVREVLTSPRYRDTNDRLPEPPR